MDSIVAGIASILGVAPVERQLVDTVNRIAIVVFRLHTVLSALEHQSAAEDSAHIGTLDGVHRASGIAAAHTAEFPVRLFDVIHQRIIALFYLVFSLIDLGTG